MKSNLINLIFTFWLDQHSSFECVVKCTELSKLITVSSAVGAVFVTILSCESSRIASLQRVCEYKIRDASTKIMILMVFMSWHSNSDNFSYSCVKCYISRVFDYTEFRRRDVAANCILYSTHNQQ